MTRSGGNHHGGTETRRFSKHRWCHESECPGRHGLYVPQTEYPRILTVSKPVQTLDVIRFSTVASQCLGASVVISSNSILIHCPAIASSNRRFDARSLLVAP